MFFREKQARHEAELARTNEIQLRHQAEIREKITRATVLLSHGEMATADDLITEIPIAICPPYMEEVRVFRELTDWNAVNGRWNQAANRASAVVQLDRVDITDKSGAVTRDYMSAAAALLQVNDLKGYAQLCRDARLRFATTVDPVSAEQVLKVNLLKPVEDEVLTSLKPLVIVASKSFSDHLPVNPTTVEAWCLMALALYEYRLNHLEKAVEYAQITLRSQDAQARTVMMNCILAMSYNRLGLVKESQESLKEGARLIEARFKKPLSSTPLDTWYSWIMARVLFEEATAQIGHPSSDLKTAGK
jgi:hypothetical protein